MRILILFICFIFLTTPALTPAIANDGDYVVLLHGIARSSSNMSKLEKHFANKGFNVINIDYKSKDYTLEILSEDVKKEISKNVMDVDKKIHFIGHSMGGLVIRSILNKYRPVNLGRVVMLGTPNQGSEVADFFKNNFLYRNFFGPAGQQLTTDQSKVKNLLGTVDYELGIIAGDRSIDPISSVILKGKDDGKVRIKNTKTKGMTDHIVIHATHTMMMKNKSVINQTEHFITHGKFKHE